MESKSVIKEYDCQDPCQYNDLYHSCFKCGYLHHPMGVYQRGERRADGSWERIKVIYKRKENGKEL